MTLAADMKLTDWIDGSIKPEREGVYERKYDEDYERIPAYCLFKHGRWHLWAYTVEQAARERSGGVLQDVLPWRGLAEPPK